jgi:acetyl esterase
MTAVHIVRRRLFTLIATLPVTLLLQAPLEAQTPTALTPAQIFQKLDPHMADVVRLFDAIKGTPIIDLTPQDARRQFSTQDAAKILTRGIGAAEAPMPIGEVQDGLTIDGPDGNQIPIRMYTPAGSGPFPVILYFHGGGFVIATIDTYDASARALCADANAIVVSAEYRKAPEAPFPAALHDAIASYSWVIAHIGQYNGVSTKIAVAGESAGGNLATEVAIAARDQSLQTPTYQLLIYPVTSGNLNQPSDLLYTSSVLPLSTPALPYFYNNYAPSEASDPQVSPINANLKNLPPTTIIAAELDPLVSDGKAYAAKLAREGNAVDYRLYSGVTHEFFGLGAFVEKAKLAEQYGAAKIAASFQ